MSATDRRSFLKTAALGAAATWIQPELGALYALPSGKALRVGLVGCGRQGRAILAELAKIEGVSVTAICDTDERRLSSSARRAPEAKAYATHAELLEANDVDAVVVATPTHLHVAPTVDALKAGKHVYCEAPLAHTIEDAKTIATAARGATGVFQAGFLGRSNPVYKLARSFVRAGAIRDVIAMRAQFRKKTSWMTPSSDPAREKALNWKTDPTISLGLAGEFGAQQLDVLQWFTGRYPEAISGSGAVNAWADGREVADTISCTLEYPEGLRTTYEATLGNSLGGTHEEIFGTMGAVRLAWTHGWMFKEADSATQGWEVYANRQSFHNDEGITLIADATKLAAQGKLKEGVGLPEPPIYYGIWDFVKSAAEGADVATGATEGLRATVVGILAAQAVSTGERVEIDPKLFEG
ncbi:MAG: Gfo/Idh/MocA family oxidoreductase [Planctomycetes bacterium]|nr:Gfo/Idh/MocA family oxidoreductase [Planctomycetota bacterium]